MYQLCIFDLDGTLINSLGDLADSVNFALRQYNLPEHPEEAYRHFVGNGAKRLIQRVLPQGREDLFQQVYETYDRRYHDCCLCRTQPYPGILSLLDEVHKAGSQIAVLSNKPDPFTRYIAGHFFPHQLDLVFGQRPGIPTKPAPDGVWEILRHFEVSPEQAILIGDSDVDIETAHQAGMSSLGVCWGFRGREELERAGADFLAADAAEAARILTSHSI